MSEEEANTCFSLKEDANFQERITSLREIYESEKFSSFCGATQQMRVLNRTYYRFFADRLYLTIRLGGY